MENDEEGCQDAESPKPDEVGLTFHYHLLGNKQISEWELGPNMLDLCRLLWRQLLGWPPNVSHCHFDVSACHVYHSEPMLPYMSFAEAEDVPLQPLNNRVDPRCRSVAFCDMP